MPGDGVDPTTITVIENRLAAITEEMGETMLRTSRSPIFSEARDFVTSIFDDEGRWVGNTGYIPIIAGATPFSQQSISEFFGDDVAEGDVFLLNDSYDGGTHLPDLAVSKPVFVDGDLAFWVMAKGHMADVGGTGLDSDTPETATIWDEGLRIPPLKLYDSGERRDDVWELLLRNVRLRDLTEGDLQCLVGSVTVGERGIHDLERTYDHRQEVKPALSSILDAGRERMTGVIKDLPDGTHRTERAIGPDGLDGDLVSITLELTVDGDRLVFDYSDSDDQCQWFLNSPYANTVAASLIPLWLFLAEDLPMNQGTLSPIEVETREGSVLDPVLPAPTSACTTTTAEAIIEAAGRCLHELQPGRSPAMSARQGSPRTRGHNPRTGREFSEIHFMCKGGGGAAAGVDGWDHVGSPLAVGLRSPDPELHELSTPFDVLDYRIWQDSAGAGRWRGGFGPVYRWEVTTDDVNLRWKGAGYRAETVPGGFAGGNDGPEKQARITRTDGTTVVPRTGGSYELDEGDVVEIYFSGGGGYGDPFERPVEAVLADLRDEKISVEAARREYGVIADPETLELDEGATSDRRKTAESEAVTPDVE